MKKLSNKLPSLVAQLILREPKLMNAKIYEKYLALGHFVESKYPKSIKLIRYRNGTYYGEANDEDQKHGVGALVDNEGNLFEGHFLNDSTIGQGRMLSITGEIFIGDWIEDEITKGTLEKEGVVYDGEFVALLPHGKGKETFADGTIYEGDFARGLREGEGVLCFNDGRVYSGNWSKGKYNGKGEFTWQNREMYKGDWQDGEMAGYGFYTWPDNSSYLGHFLRSGRHGEGKFTWADGKSCQGFWENDNLNGTATITLEDASEYKTEWTNGQMKQLPELELLNLAIPKCSKPNPVAIAEFNVEHIETQISLRKEERMKKEADDQRLKSAKKNKEEERMRRQTGIHETGYIYAGTQVPSQSFERPKTSAKTDSPVVSKLPLTHSTLDLPKPNILEDNLDLSEEEDSTQQMESFVMSDDEEMRIAPELNKVDGFPAGVLKPRDIDKRPKYGVSSLSVVEGSIRYGMSDAEIAESLDDLISILKLVKDVVVTAQVINVRARLKSAEYFKPTIRVGFIEWTKLSDNSYYKGEINDHNIRWGRGVHLDDGELYEGNWVGGKKSGFGRHLNMYADCYIGNWANDIRSGFGVLRRLEGYGYVGDWEHDVPNGKGVESTHYGNYEGDFKLGVREGKGYLKFSDGSHYKGDFAKGNIEGFGVYTQGGKSYIGNWSANILSKSQVQVTSSMHIDPVKHHINPTPFDAYFSQSFPTYSQVLAETQDIYLEIASEVIRALESSISAIVFDEVISEYITQYLSRKASLLKRKKSVLITEENMPRRSMNHK